MGFEPTTLMSKRSSMKNVLNVMYTQNEKVISYLVRILLVEKISRFQTSFQWVTGICLKPSQFFLFKIFHQIWSLKMFKVRPRLSC